MNKLSAIGIDIEDYFGKAIGSIDFENPIELKGESFNVVDNFSFSGEEYYEGDGYVIRLQYEHELPTGDLEDINLAHSQIIDIIIDSCEYLENEKEIYKELLEILEIVI